jgi:excisionase family DNA binding protein
VSSDATGKFAPARADAEDVYTMAEAARLKGVSYHTVSRAVRRGILPADRIGKMVFITTADLRSWHPKYDRAPLQYRGRNPVPDAKPALIDLASGERVLLASRLANLVEVAETAARDLPLEETLGLACERLAGALGLRRVALWRVDRSHGHATFTAGHGSPLADLPERIELTDFPQFAGVLRKADGAVVVDVASLGDRVPEPFRRLPSLLVVPLRLGDRTLGHVFGDRNGAAFSLSADDLVFARAVANQVALTLALVDAREAAVAKVGSGKRGLPRVVSA